MIINGRQNGIQKNRHTGSALTSTVAILNSLFTTLQTMTSHVLDVRDVLRHIRRNQDRMLQNEISFSSNNHNDLENIGRVISTMKEEFSSLYQRSQGARSNSEDKQENANASRTRAMACLSYLKVFVAAAMLGKGMIWDFFCTGSYESEILKEACSFVIGNSTPSSEIDTFLGSYSLADRSGVTKVFLHHEFIESTRNKKLKTVRQRMATTKRRLHESIAPRVVNAWMKYAPNFQEYRSSSSVKSQPRSVLVATKRACTIEDGEVKGRFLTQTQFGEAFRQACKELTRCASFALASGLEDCSKTMGEEKYHEILDKVHNIDVKWGRSGDQVCDIIPGDVYTAEQLAFVTVKVGAKLQDLSMACDQRFRRGLELGHYKMWLREVLVIDELVRASCTNEKLQEASENPFSNCPCIADEVLVYGAKVHSILSSEVLQKVRTILNGACTSIKSPRIYRRRGVLETHAENESEIERSNNSAEDEESLMDTLENAL